MDQSTHAETAVLVSFGEIGTKSRQVRTKMTRRLRNNLTAVLSAREIAAEVDQRWSRLVVRTDDADAAARAVADAPGVVWARPSAIVPATVDAVRDALERAAADHDEGTFAVRANRVGDAAEHDFSSRDLEVEGGRVVGELTGADVDLDEPDRTYRVEVRNDRAYVAGTTYDGPGGLPLGTQDPVVALVSGGHDSPVAAWELMRRGAPVIPVYVSLGDFGGPDNEARALATVQRLAEAAPNFDLDLRIVPLGGVVETLMNEVDETRMLSLRRAMLRVAEAVAEHENAVGIVTGEALGQKSSQTAANLAVTDAAATLPVHRPLLTCDKPDIVERARELGTYEDSSMAVGCQQVDPEFPETRATLDGVEAAEPDGLLARAADAASRLDVVAVDARDA
ncbi:tRNA sulfurtransferase [Salinirarus marinus]|uniref:tRNA sulfurtransferase n=1 Tax=Salinirarus marinus TaxID=3068310 RepID=UPI003C6C9415